VGDGGAVAGSDEEMPIRGKTDSKKGEGEGGAGHENEVWKRAMCNVK